jgi:hypothetical protein
MEPDRFRDRSGATGVGYRVILNGDGLLLLHFKDGVLLTDVALVSIIIGMQVLQARKATKEGLET